jgi:DNA-binding transcriptional MocR family regulator
MVECIREHFPPGAQVHDPDAGMLLWVELPPGVSSRRLFSRALAERVRVLPGALFSSNAHFDGYLRLSCGWPLTPQRAAAVATLGQLCAALMRETSGAHPL